MPLNRKRQSNKYSITTYLFHSPPFPPKNTSEKIELLTTTNEPPSNLLPSMIFMAYRQQRKNKGLI